MRPTTSTHAGGARPELTSPIGTLVRTQDRADGTQEVELASANGNRITKFRITSPAYSEWRHEARVYESSGASWTFGTRTREQVIAALVGRFDLKWGEPRGHLVGEGLEREQQRPLGHDLRLTSGLSLARPWPQGGRLTIEHFRTRGAFASGCYGDIAAVCGHREAGYHPGLWFELWRQRGHGCSLDLLDRRPRHGERRYSWLQILGAEQTSFETLVAMALAVLDERARDRSGPLPMFSVP